MTLLARGVLVPGLLLTAAIPALAQSSPIEILFVGNSFTFGKYAPVRNYMGGYDSGPGAVSSAHVHDLQCLTAATCSAAENLSLVHISEPTRPY